MEERGAQGFSQPHNLVPHLFVPPSNCDYCYQMIIGILNKGDFPALLINRQVGLEATKNLYDCSIFTSVHNMQNNSDVQVLSQFGQVSEKSLDTFPKDSLSKY